MINVQVCYLFAPKGKKTSFSINPVNPDSEKYTLTPRCAALRAAHLGVRLAGGGFHFGYNNFTPPGFCSLVGISFIIIISPLCRLKICLNYDKVDYCD
jgi:hypothetical protein